MCLPAVQNIPIDNKTGSDPLKSPEVRPITENLSTHQHENTSRANCYIRISFFFSFATLSLEKVYDKFYALEVGRRVRDGG